MTLIMIAFYVLFPALAIDLCRRFPAVDKIGAVIICYVFGIIIGNIGLLGPKSDSILDLLTTITIPIALPLLLFSLDMRQWFRLAGKTMLSLALIIIAVSLMATICHLVMGSNVDEAWKVSGLMIGVYTGGTPNLAAIKTALDVNPSTYLAVHTADVAIGAVYILFAITIGQKLLLYFLPPFTASTESTSIGGNTHMNDYTGICKRVVVLGLLKALGVSLMIFIIGGGLTLVLPKNMAMAAAILVITTLGIAASMVDRIRKIPMTFQLGQYFILVFCLAVASMADLNRLVHAAPIIILWVTLMVFGSMMIHIVLAMVFKIDADIVLVTSVAAICSPPFVPMVAGALKNRDIVVSGLTTGIIGYALGNYLGVFGAYLFRGL